jgi:hypothetical protein
MQESNKYYLLVIYISERLYTVWEIFSLMSSTVTTPVTSTLSAAPAKKVVNPFNAESVLPLLSQPNQAPLQTAIPDQAQQIIHGIQLQPYQKTRSLTKNETTAVKDALTRWWDNVVQSEGMPIIGKLAHPGKKGLLSGSIAAAGTMGLGSLFTDAAPHLDTLAPIAGLAGLSSGSVYWLKQKTTNQNVIDFLRLSPVENPSVRIMNSDFGEVFSKILNKQWFNLNVKNIAKGGAGGGGLLGLAGTASGAVALWEFVTHHPLQVMKGLATGGWSVVQGLFDGLA